MAHYRPLMFAVIFAIAILAIGVIGIKRLMYNEPISPWITGGVIGVLIWAYDYSFFLAAGGPSTRISDAICDFLGIEYYATTEYLFLFVPLILLVIAGSASVAFISVMARKIRAWMELR